MRFSFFYFPLSLLLSLAPFQSAFAWGEPHHAITGAAVEVLPAWQKELLGEEVARLGDSYCMIPDHVFTDKANAKFAQMESAPGEVYLKILHLPTQQPEYLEVIRYFMERAVLSLREGNVGNASRYMGTICHQIEDYGSPSHTVPGDNMFTLLQQFLPPSAAMQDQLMHGPIENGDFAVSIAEYHPVLLGTTVNEASWRLMHRIHEAILNARSTTIPIMQALYAEDQASVVKHQLRAAVVDAQVVADAMYTILCLGAERDLAAEEMVRIDEFFPLEAASLYYPQSEFFSAPHWGYPRRGLILAGGKKAVPLKLRLETGEQEFRNGISAGMGKSLTFLLPREVYRRFTVQAGLHPELGALGRVEFTIAGDGKPLASVIVGGADSAKTLECEIAGVNRLQLSLASRGIDAKSAYAIWADPILWK